MSADIRNPLLPWAGDWGAEAVARSIRGHKVFHMEGRSDGITTSWLDVWPSAAIYTLASASYSLEVLSSSANDTAAGSGARTVTVQGLDANWVEQEETVSMNGAAAVSLSSTWQRVNRMFVATAGTYATTSAGANAGTITLRIAGGGATKAVIGVTATGTYGLGQSQQAIYTVPIDRIAVIKDCRLRVDASATVDFMLWARASANTVAAPYSSKRCVLHVPGVTGGEVINLTVPLGPFTGPEDIWWAALAASGTVRVEVQSDVVLL